MPTRPVLHVGSLGWLYRRSSFGLPFYGFLGVLPVRLLHFAALVMDMCCAGLPLILGSVAHTWAGFVSSLPWRLRRWHGAALEGAVAHGVSGPMPHMCRLVSSATCRPSLTHLWMAGDERTRLTSFLGHEHVPYGIFVLQFWDPPHKQVLPLNSFTSGRCFLAFALLFI